MKELVRENVDRFAMLMSYSKPRRPLMMIAKETDLLSLGNVLLHRFTDLCQNNMCVSCYMLSNVRVYNFERWSLIIFLGEYFSVGRHLRFFLSRVP